MPVTLDDGCPPQANRRRGVETSVEAQNQRQYHSPTSMIPVHVHTQHRPCSLCTYQSVCVCVCGATLVVCSSHFFLFFSSSPLKPLWSRGEAPTMSPVQAVVPMTPSHPLLLLLHRADSDALFSPCEVCIAGS